MEDFVQAGENQWARAREKAAEATKVLEKLDILRWMRATVEMLRVYALFSRKIGKIQIDNPEAFEAMKYLGDMAPEIMKRLSERSQPAEFGMFVRASLALFELAPKLERMMDLSGKEKIELGKKLEEIANSLNQFVKTTENSRGGEK